MSNLIEIQLIAILISVTCGFIGTFLVLMKRAMLSDSITHTILLGIVIAYFIVEDLNSPVLIIGATITGVATVWFTQHLAQKNLVSEESAIGLVFPFLFSIAIILISKHASNTHIDTDTVLLGELAFAPFNRLVIFGTDIGAKALYSTSFVLFLNLVYVTLFFKEIKLAIFDKTLAIMLGIAPTFIYYSLMTMVSLTTVVAFEAVGSVLVVAFMVGPSVTALLISHNLKVILALSCVFSCISSTLGLFLALALDVSIAGSMSVMVGIVFLLVWGFVSFKSLRL